MIQTNVIGLRYFDTMGIALLAGRDFSERDIEGAPGVAIVNESFVKRYFAGQGALGRRVKLGGGDTPWREIVGIVRDSKYRTLGEAQTPFIYQPLPQQHETGMILLVRTERDPSAILGGLRGTLLALERNLPVSSLQPLSTLLASSLFPARMAARLLTGFAALAALLAAVGLYGAMSFTVSRRTREMGVRSALGANERHLMALVIREGFVLVGAGVAIGCIIAALVTRFAAGFFYDVSPTDPVIFAVVGLLLGLVMLVATFFPARRASQCDPLAVLRME